MVLRPPSPRAARGRACGGAVKSVQRRSDAVERKSTVWVKMVTLDDTGENKAKKFEIQNTVMGVDPERRDE